MKKIFYLTVAFTILSFSAYFAVSDLNMFPKSATAKERSLSKVIDIFWQNSLQGNTAELEKLITHTPDDFYTMKNLCDEKRGDISKKVDLSEGSLTKVSDSVDDSFSQENRKFINKISSTIKQGNYRHYKIVDEKVTDDHALLRVAYGKDDSMIYGDLFLLNKKNNEWKIFMVTSDWELELVNKNYATTECPEN